MRQLTNGLKEEAKENGGHLYVDTNPHYLAGGYETAAEPAEQATDQG